MHENIKQRDHAGVWGMMLKRLLIKYVQCTKFCPGVSTPDSVFLIL